MKRNALILLCIGWLLSGIVAAQEKLTLEQALELALKNNYDIQVSRQAAQVSQVNNTLGNAGMLPTLSATGTAAWSQTNEDQTLSNNTQTNTTVSRSSAAIGVDLNWTLFDGGKMFVTRERLQQTEKLGEIRLRETIQQTAYEIVVAFYNLVRLQQQLLSIEQTIRYNRERLTISEAAFKSGDNAKTDLLQARIDLNEAEENALIQQVAIREAKRNLNLLMVRNLETAFTVTDEIVAGTVPEMQVLLQQLETSNTSLQGFQKQVELSSLAYEEAKANYLPRFDLGAGYTHSLGGSSGTVKNYTNTGPDVSGRLSIPIYQAGQASRLKKIADLNRQTAEVELERAKLEVQAALQNAYEDYANQKTLMQMETTNSDLSKQLLELSIERLRLGHTTSLEVHLAQQNFVLSNTRLINYKFGLKLAETRIKQLISAL